jgi:glyoxylate reductase
VARILVTHQLPDGALDSLVEHEVDQRDGEWHDGLPDADAVLSLLTDRVDRAALDRASKLRVVSNVAVGYDNIDVAECERRGIVVTNTPGVLDETTADTAFALILAASRLLSEAERDLRAGAWRGWDMTSYVGRDVHGATLGLVGYGRIGKAVARRAAGFGMIVMHHTRHDTGEPGWTNDLDLLLRSSDVVSLHCPLTPETRGLIGATELAHMPAHAVLVNTARGPVVDEDALADALESGRLFAAGLDVYADEPRVSPRLLVAPRTVLLPHIGSASIQTRTEMARLAAESARMVLAGERPHTVVSG